MALRAVRRRSRRARYAFVVFAVMNQHCRPTTHDSARERLRGRPQSVTLRPFMNAPLAHPPKAADVPSAEGVTPVMAQFLAAKASQPDAIVFFRMGDFYEL